MSLLQAHAEAILHDLLRSDDPASGSGSFDLELGGRSYCVTVTAAGGEPYSGSSETTVRVLVEAPDDRWALGYAAGVHEGGPRPMAWNLG